MSVSAPPVNPSPRGRTSPSRRRRAPWLLAATAMLASACGVSRSDREATAATITYGDGTEVVIDAAELDELTAEVTGNDAFRSVAYGSAEVADIERDLLTRLVVGDAAEKVLADNGGEPDPAVAEENRTLLIEQLGSFLEVDADAAPAEEVAEEISGFIDVLVDIQTDQQALGAILAADSPGIPCSSHILVEDEALAEDLLVQLDDGADFAELALEYSTDPGSAASGGELGCTDPSVFVPEFAEALTSGTEGEVMGPIETQFGFHLIVITGYEAAGGEALAGAELETVLQELTVVVDDAIGIWDPLSLAVTGTDG